MKKASRKKAAMKKRVVSGNKRTYRQEAMKEPPKDMREDGVLCPDCREPMTQVLTGTLKYYARWILSGQVHRVILDAENQLNTVLTSTATPGTSHCLVTCVSG